MFWNFGISVSAIDQIFDREEPPTLEEVLEEPELIQEVKSQNDKLINFLTDEENIKKIIYHIINGDGIFRRKCHDILVSSVGIINHTVFESPSFLTTLWAVFHSNSDDMSILGHIVSIFTHYATHKSAELFNFFLHNKIDFFDDIMLKLNYPPVCELMTRMVCNKISDACSSFQDQFIQNNITYKLINLMSIEHSPEIAGGASAVIAELLHTIRNDNISEEVSVFEITFTETLFADENMNILVNNIIAAKANPQISISGASVLSLILDLQRCGHASGDEFISPCNIPARFIKFSKREFSKFSNNIELLLNILKEPSKSCLDTENSESFGRLKLYILESIVSLILYNDENLSEKLCILNVPIFLMELFEKYPEHNLMHSLVQLAISSILMGYKWKNRIGTLLYIDNILISSLFSSDFFVRKLLHLSIQNQSYIAHVREIQRTLNLSTTDSYHRKIISEKMDEFSDDLKEALSKAKELLVGIDEIEVVDDKFLRAISDDFEIQDLFFPNDTTHDFISLEKSNEFFKEQKSNFSYEDDVETFQDKMNLELDTLFPSDPFTHVNIQRTPLDYNIQPYDGIVEVVQESINDIIYPVSSPSNSEQNSLVEEDQDVDAIIDHANNQSVEPLMRIDIDGPCSGSNDDSFSYVNDEQLSTGSQDQLLDQDQDSLQTNRCATSSPLSTGSNATPDEDADIFEDEIISE